MSIELSHSNYEWSISVYVADNRYTDTVTGEHPGSVNKYPVLTPWDRDKMAANFLTTFKYIQGHFCENNHINFDKVSPKFVHKGLIRNIPALVRMMIIYPSQQPKRRHIDHFMIGQGIGRFKCNAINACRDSKAVSMSPSSKGGKVFFSNLPMIMSCFNWRMYKTLFTVTIASC